ncbi:YjbH domain-containing protein [Sedimentimonas flavescens]|uniref:YjbH domain-containing protein n=1 Tax=Sedimentimonas flavescens TaxID=2851012 RepID=A0ABT2ZV58_9RHOB|nr:YjbH domain-containing protein [Sedimentimonas flavescens]MCV2877642.1 YjbH domain-containing protein [Sedimentimonas flavescens]
MTSNKKDYRFVLSFWSARKEDLHGLFPVISGSGAALVIGASAVCADPVPSLYGPAGLMDMPTAEMARDGTVSLGVAHLPDSVRFSAGFQALPRVNLTFRYSGIGDEGGYTESSGYSLWDRSLDLSVLLWPEGEWNPAIAIGARDILGTGVMASEYLVATKTLTPDLSATLGFGWGRLASGNQIGSTGERPTETGDTGGQLRLESMFRGDVGVFGGLRWQTPVDGLSLAVEYSSDDYSAEAPFGVSSAEQPWSLGLNWKTNPNLNIGLAALNGRGVALSLTSVLDPRGPDLFPKAPWVPRSGGSNVADAFDGSGVAPMAFGSAGEHCTATIEVRGVRSAAVAIDRAGRALAREGCRAASVRIAREGMTLSETQLDLTQAEPVVLGAEPAGPGSEPARRIVEPAFDWALSPLMRYSLFDPDQPLYFDLSAAIQARYRLASGLSLSGQLSQTIAGNFDDMTRGPKGSLPRVRTESYLYDQEKGPRLDYLTLDLFQQHTSRTFSRLSLGYLETQYAGLSAELYMRHASLPLAFGAELNVLKARDFDQGFGLRDLPGLAAVNGHASLYWETGFHGIDAQLDVGRYLAGDLGGTLSVSRDFQNGWKIGAFATLTDASAEDFGEGSFDKGVFFRVPVAAFGPRETALSAESRISSLTGDGGQRVAIRNRLHEIVSRGDARAVLAGCRQGVPCFSR